MRRKLRELLDREEGFTLVELLAVLAILAIIVAIAVPAIGNVVGRSETKANEAEKALIVDAARLYDIDKTEVQETGTEWISAKDLVDEGYLDFRGKTEAEIEASTDGVMITRKSSTETDSGGTTYEYHEKNPASGGGE